MREKHLGKITSIKYGFGGYDDVMFGLSITISGDSLGVSDFKGTWASEPTERSKWTKADQLKIFSETSQLVLDLLRKAKVNDVTQLKGKPVEWISEDNMLVEWRILEEVL